MHQTIKLTSFILLLSNSLFGQTETPKTTALPSSRWSVFWSPTRDMFLSMSSQRSDLYALAASYGILESEAVYQIYPSFYNFGRGSNTSHRFGVEYQFKKGIKTRDVNLSYRTDFQYKSTSGIHQDFAQVNSFLVDSAYVSSLNTTVWQDSVYYDQFGASITQESFLWSNAILMRIAENKRWSFYTGIQLGLQFNFSRRFNLQEDNYAFLDTYVSEVQKTDRTYSLTNQIGTSSNSREEKLANTVDYHVSVPIGFDFRIRNTRFWNHFHLYGEGNLGLSIRKNYTQLNFTQSFGLRYKF
ncbi:MAG: hypothetical protein WC044_03320 [Crocinitomicaceae bacterium]